MKTTNGKVSEHYMPVKVGCKDCRKGDFVSVKI